MNVRSTGGKSVQEGVLGEVGLKICPKVYRCLKMNTMAAIDGVDTILKENLR